MTYSMPRTLSMGYLQLRVRSRSGPTLSGGFWGTDHGLVDP